MSSLIKVREQLMFMGIIAIPKERFPLVLQPLYLVLHRIHAVIVLIVLLPLLVSVVYFTSTEAKTFADYAESSLFCVAALLQLAFYIVVILNKQELMCLMKEFDEIIQTSECFVLLFLT